jgi:Fe-S cluster biogenesis protein NfuA
MMVESVSDPKMDLVLQNIETMVASEGGSLELVNLGETSLEVKYYPGVNEECPECVPTHEAVTRFLSTSLKIHVPEITDVSVT